MAGSLCTIALAISISASKPATSRPFTNGGKITTLPFAPQSKMAMLSLTSRRRRCFISPPAPLPERSPMTLRKWNNAARNRPIKSTCWSEAPTNQKLRSKHRTGTLESPSTIPSSVSVMPSFDIVSEVDKQEIDNALNQARKELATRFDLKDAKTEIVQEKDKIVLGADDGNHLRALREIVVGKLSKRGVDLRNVKQEEAALSSVGHARQELKIQQGLEGDKAKEIIQAIKSQNFKIQSQLQDRQIRVTGKKKDELQTVIQFVRGRDFGVATNFKNFRD